MSRDIYGSQMADISADAALRRDYLDPATVEVGDRVPYRDESDDTDDRAWHDAVRTLARRGLCLVDDGSGLVVTADERPSYF